MAGTPAVDVLGEQLWPRARGRSSPITVVVLTSTVSAPGCAPAPAGLSLRPAAVRAALGSPLSSPRRRAVLPTQYKLNSRDFSRTMRGGRKSGSRTLVVHAHRPEPNAAAPRVGGPRFGLTVSKAVGNAVIRHRVARRLRHICLELAAELDPQLDLVVRALPRAAHADSATLLADLRKALRRATAS